MKEGISGWINELNIYMTGRYVYPMGEGKG